MLQVEIKEGVWALGDCASIPDGNGGFHPPTAQHALRQARTAARNLVASIRGEALKPFSFRTIGQLAAIGRRTGVAQMFGRRFSGFIAWWMWRTIYLSKLPGLEKRLRVVLDWTLDLVFAKDTVQYTSFRTFSEPTPSSPFHDPEQPPHNSELDPRHRLGSVQADPQSEKPIENLF
jgi:NADH:ubiquinone reductase (H+-translocating)